MLLGAELLLELLGVSGSFWVWTLWKLLEGASLVLADTSCRSKHEPFGSARGLLSSRSLKPRAFLFGSRLLLRIYARFLHGSACMRRRASGRTKCCGFYEWAVFSVLVPNVFSMAEGLPACMGCIQGLGFLNYTSKEQKRLSEEKSFRV